MNELGPTRQHEARKFLDTALKGDFDRDHLLAGLHAILTGRVPVIAAAANELRKWNDKDDEVEQFRFVGEDNYDTIVEIVLDTAARYRGEDSDESVTSNSEMEQGIVGTLQQIQLFLCSIAAGRINTGLAETHANRLRYIISWLTEVKNFSQPVTN